jgi:hypothetical protein
VQRQAGSGLRRERRVINTNRLLRWLEVTASETAIGSDVEVGLLLRTVVARMDVVVVGEDP